MAKSTLVGVSEIQTMIIELRGHRVILDKDLAKLYSVPTKRLIEQVKRNQERFPSDFIFQLTDNEFEFLRSQFATSSWGGRRYLPY
ncbi:MAG: ORF6N domain-containing protein, partial [Candidatus Margulisbacteria bacterium]|nr:ORF6N domain-containing protein [Candidatus Margulisiibacteriota bacterium]